MKKTKIITYALANALWTALYIILVGTFFYSAPAIFGRGGDTVMIPIIMLLLFVLSASITGGLILGRPILWYLDGRKKDAITLLGFTLAIFFIVTILMVVVMYINK
jgi:hypothetical protein